MKRQKINTRRKETGHRFRKCFNFLIAGVPIPNSTIIIQVFSTGKTMHEAASLTPTLDRGHQP